MRQRSSRLHSATAAVSQWISWLYLNLATRSHGQGLVEYGLILVLIMVVCVGILTMTGNTISRVWYDQLLGAFPD